jgi:arylsulfatase
MASGVKPSRIAKIRKAQGADPEANLTNLVVFCADQLRYDGLGANGNNIVRTPNIDRVAQRGVRFHRHYTPNQICSPSRATMISGLYPRHHRLHRNGVALGSDIPTLPTTLANAGYRTFATGKLHFQPLLAPVDRGMPESLAFWETEAASAWHGPYYGFQEVRLVLQEANESVKAGHYANWLRRYHPEVVALYEPDVASETRDPDLAEVWKSAVPADLHYNTWIADQAIDFIQSVAEGEAFFLYVSYPDPHHPFAPPRPFCDLYDPDQMPLPKVVPGEQDRMPDYLQTSDDPRLLAYTYEPGQVREQGFMLRTDRIGRQSVARAIAHTYGMIEMIDLQIGRTVRALRERGLFDNTMVVFTSDHGELLGDHGLLRKGPPPYRQLLQIPFILSGAGVPEDKDCHALTSHLDIFATALDLLNLPAEETAGRSLGPLLRGARESVRDTLFAEYHPRVRDELYNQSIITGAYRLTLYPLKPEWGELFDLVPDPWEHHNLFHEKDCRPIVTVLGGELARHMPPRPLIDAEVLGAY